MSNTPRKPGNANVIGHGFGTDTGCVLLDGHSSRFAALRDYCNRGTLAETKHFTIFAGWHHAVDCPVAPAPGLLSEPRAATP